MTTSRLSAKGQVTLPKKVRETLSLGPGDLVAYEIGEGKVAIRKVQPFDAAFHAALSATLDEWASKKDDEAFRGL